MSEPAITYLQVHQQLTTWNDELEFLGYILAEIINPKSFETVGFPCHQAADLPTIINILRYASYHEDSRLRTVSTEEELKIFRRLMTKSKRIRNATAHHQLPNEARLAMLRDVKEQLCARLESLIQSAALRFEISQVDWHPYHHTPGVSTEAKASVKVAICIGDEPLLSLREQILRNRRHERKATDKSRRDHWQAFEAAQRRRKEKQEQHLERTRKQNLDQESKRAETSYKLRQMMDKMHVSHGGTLFSDPDEILILILLAITSPFWLAGILIKRLRIYV